MAKKPTLKIVKSSPSITSPPRALGKHGHALWDKVMSEYQIADSGGVEILLQICSALDRAEELAEQLGREGCTIIIKGVPREHPCLKGELANRAFICRGLQRLGLNVEAVKPVGRPGGWSS
jgi:hypothetical protein